jgi:hypothetical protein
MTAAKISIGRIAIAAALVALASFLAICVVRATALPRTNGFAASLTTGTPTGPAHAFVAAESPPQAFAFRPSLPGDSPRPVIAHYFPPYPLTIGGRDPANDYYANHYLRRDGENGKFAPWGGLLRQRPLPGPRARPQLKSDLRVEVARAARIGIDVFGVDLLRLDGKVAEVVPNLLEAAHETDPRFRVMIQPDMSSLRKVTLDQLVEYLLGFAKHPAAFRAADGRLVVMPFRTEARPPEFWQALIERMAQAGEPVAFIPFFVDPSGARGYAPFSAAATRGTTADATGGLAQRTFGLRASALGYPGWIANAAPQDVRAKYGVAWEAEGSKALAEAVKAGIDGGASGLHFMTWNDYSEATEIQPSTATRFAYYDLTAYHIAWFKTGAPPRIERDGFVGLHRRQLFRPDNRALGRPWRARGRPVVDLVEMTAFLTAPAELAITSGGRTFREKANAGLHRFTAPAAIGPVSMSITRGGKIVAWCKSPWTIEAEPDRQDPLYAGFSSLRGCE